MKISSTEFNDGQTIPKQFTCDGEGINPPLRFEDIPENCQSLAFIVEDPDAPAGTFVHWLLWNIPANVTGIESGQTPAGAVSGVNTAGQNGYVPPCPPNNEHHYIFRLFALDKMLVLGQDGNKNDLVQEMEGHVLDRADLVGLYAR